MTDASILAECRINVKKPVTAGLGEYFDNVTEDGASARSACRRALTVKAAGAGERRGTSNNGGVFGRILTTAGTLELQQNREKGSMYTTPIIAYTIGK
ncbi:hypothetical protein [Paenibacillus xanthanilyticus]|uniref:Uncharacterized protein n=1 Tax=Paenibacillus xanthanilyticus TaxID=1783531 RepID=A0ABV8K3I3_9BACL